VNGSVGQVIDFRTHNEALANHIEIPSFDDRQKGTIDFSRQPVPDSKDTPIWPVVRFPNDRQTLILPADFTINNAEGGIEAQRTQVFFHRHFVLLSNTIECTKGPAYTGLGS
jgi:hypothetical protein